MADSNADTGAPAKRPRIDDAPSKDEQIARLTRALVAANEDTRKAADDARKAAEDARKAAERADAAEQAKKVFEDDARKAAEEVRNAAEEVRKAAERADAAEQARLAAERRADLCAEDARACAEDARTANAFAREAVGVVADLVDMAGQNKKNVQSVCASEKRLRNYVEYEDQDSPPNKRFVCAGFERHDDIITVHFIDSDKLIKTEAMAEARPFIKRTPSRCVLSVVEAEEHIRARGNQMLKKRKIDSVS